MLIPLAAVGLQPANVLAQVANSALVDANGTESAVDISIYLDIGETLPVGDTCCPAP